MPRIFLVFLLVALAGCSGSKNLYRYLSKDDSSRKTYEGHYKVGKAYTQKGEMHTPKATANYSATGLASWYGTKGGFHKKRTANGDKYQPKLLTAAHKTLPMPSLIEVTNLANNKSLILIVNDRGPFRKDRVVDVSAEAAQILGFKQQGIAKVKVRSLPKETAELLQKINLPAIEGKRVRGPIKESKCSLNCHVKMLNISKGHHRFDKHK